MTDSLSPRSFIKASGAAIGRTALPMSQIEKVTALCGGVEYLVSFGEITRASAAAVNV